VPPAPGMGEVDIHLLLNRTGPIVDARVSRNRRFVRSPGFHQAGREAALRIWRAGWPLGGYGHRSRDSIQDQPRSLEARHGEEY
jgi:hypothetical protein